MCPGILENGVMGGQGEGGGSLLGTVMLHGQTGDPKWDGGAAQALLNSTMYSRVSN